MILRQSESGSALFYPHVRIHRAYPGGIFSISIPFMKSS
jgi:hypothetical protein